VRAQNLLALTRTSQVGNSAQSRMAGAGHTSEGRPEVEREDERSERKGA
jgi:hypothetical protein